VIPTVEPALGDRPTGPSPNDRWPPGARQGSHELDYFLTARRRGNKRCAVPALRRFPHWQAALKDTSAQVRAAVSRRSGPWGARRAATLGPRRGPE